MTEGKQQLLDPRGAGARDPKCVLGTIKRDGDRLLFEGDGGVGQFVLFPEPLAEEQPRGLEGERVSLHLTPLVRLIYQLGPIDPPITCYLPAPIDLKDLERMHEGSEEIAAVLQKKGDHFLLGGLEMPILTDEDGSKRLQDLVGKRLTGRLSPPFRVGTVVALSRRPPATCYIVATPLDFGGDFLSEKARHLREKEWRQVMGLLPSLQRRPVRFEDPRVILCYIPAPWLRMVREDLREDLLKGFVQRGVIPQEIADTIHGK